VATHASLAIHSWISPPDHGKGKDVSLDILFMGATQSHSTEDDSKRPAGRILVVDRDASVRATIASLLSMAGCEVRTAQSAAAGLRFVRIWHPTLIFLDPYIRGRAPLDVIRAFWEAGQRHAPLVLLGGAELHEDGKANETIAGHLAKPFDVRELLRTTARFVSCGGS
jgi:CheY-like chemotaxis protein